MANTYAKYKYDSPLYYAMSKRLNRLAYESSPYLLQHADNPVDWYPWCEEALKRARDEDKPIFLSIGYSACHWCHVMEHESFEDEEIARLMNEHFINIKVDREERPDIDDVYQKVCQIATGTGGWPLSVFLTPDLKPFYIGTYFPKEERYGLPSFPRLLKYLADLYRNDREKVNMQVEMIMQGISLLDKSIRKSYEDVLDKSILDEGAVRLLDGADMVNGGFGNAPKFPNVTNLTFMLRYYRLSRISRFLSFVLFTLDKMANGGIHDHIGGGFHRYATDSKWLIPHFEKMLYDNALLSILYAETYQASKDHRYLAVVKDTLNYMLREMQTSEGLFCSSQDADSEGEEGKYYTWSKREVLDIIDSNDAEIACMYFGITEQGNFDGKNVLYVAMDTSKIAKIYGKSIEEVNLIIEECKRVMLDARERRVKPARDDKAILAWNALALSAMAKGYKVSMDERYLSAALNACKVIEQRLAEGSRLYRIYKDDKAKILAYLDDYSFYINTLLDIFSVEPRAYYINRAVEYADYMLGHFWDANTNDLYYTSDEHEQLIIRDKSIYDLSIPSGNSMAALALLRLYTYTHDNEYLVRCEQILKAHAMNAAENPYAYANMLNTLFLYMVKPLEVTVIAEPSSRDVERVKDLLWRSYIPEIIDVILDSSRLKYLSSINFFKGKAHTIGKEFTVYVCKDMRCSLPLHSIEEVEGHVMA